MISIAFLKPPWPCALAEVKENNVKLQHRGLFFPLFNLFVKVEGDFAVLSYAYPLSFNRAAAQRVARAFYSFGNRVRARFSRDDKPIKHLGDVTPEFRTHIITHPDQDLEVWPKQGTTHEDMEIYSASDLSSLRLRRTCQRRIL